MFVKVCGCTKPEHLRWAAELGYDAAGIVLHPGSPRYCEPDRARDLARAAEGLLVRVAVGLTYDEVAPVRPYFEYIQIYERFSADRFILAGTEDPEGARFDFFLYDASRGKGVSGSFPSWLARYRDRLILSGGLRCGSIARDVGALAPFGIDVSSGVEETPGLKSHRLMASFIEEARCGAE